MPFFFADEVPTDVVRVVRVDVPSVVRSYDAVKSDPAVADPPLLLGCAYALYGGENDPEDGEEAAVAAEAAAAAAAAAGHGNVTTAGHGSDMPAATTTTARPADGKRSLLMPVDRATDEEQRRRGIVVKWYFRRNPSDANDLMSSIGNVEQVYQWIAGAGPAMGQSLGPLRGRVVDVSAQTPRLGAEVLHRVLRVERPTAELTGEYRCQVEDWNAERRSAWQPLIVYSEYTSYAHRDNAASQSANFYVILQCERNTSRRVASLLI